MAGACTDWQGGGDFCSSPLRAAARVLTGTRHYFAADYMETYEQRAGRNDRLLTEAQILLDAVAAAPHRTTAEWAAATGVTAALPTVGFAGRGLVARPGDDEQIAAAVGGGRPAHCRPGVCPSTPTRPDSLTAANRAGS